MMPLGAGAGSGQFCECGHAKELHPIVLRACQGRDSYRVRCTCPAFVLASDPDDPRDRAEVEDGLYARPKSGESPAWVDEIWDEL